MTDATPRADIPSKEVKEVSITLEFSQIARDYEVTQIVNSTFYKPGDWIKEEAVAKLCNMRGWTVVMSKQDLKFPIPIPTPFGFIGG